MSWFSKDKRQVPRIRTPFATFEFDGEAWKTPLSDPFYFILSVPEFDVSVVERAASLLERIDEFTNAAKYFIRTEGTWAELENAVTLESIDITELCGGNFSMCFGGKADEDFTLHVEFANHIPTGVWAAD